MKYYSSIVLGLFSSVLTMASDLRAPFELESSKTLPKGVWNPRFKSIFSPADSKYDSLGLAQPLAAPLNKSISFSDVIASKSVDADKAAIRSFLQGIPESASAGSINAEVKTYTTAFVPVLAYGLSDRWTLGIAVPLIHADLSVDAGFSKTADGQTLIDRSAGSSSSYNVDSAKNDLNNALQNQLSSKGYNPLKNKTVIAPGDLKVINKYLLYKKVNQTLSVKQDVTIPTGVQPNSNELIDLATGDGQWDLGATLVFDQKRILKDLGVSTYAGYNVQLPDSIEKRIPTPGQTLSADKEIVSRDLGDTLSSGAAVNYEFPRLGTTLGTGYHVQYQSKTSYQGKAYASERYRLLEGASPSQTIHSMTMSAGFSSVDWYKQGRFAYPFEVVLNYNKILSGRNVLKSDSVAAEMVLFF